MATHRLRATDVPVPSSILRRCLWVDVRHPHARRTKVVQLIQNRGQHRLVTAVALPGVARLALLVPTTRLLEACRALGLDAALILGARRERGQDELAGQGTGRPERDTATDHRGVGVVLNVHVGDHLRRQRTKGPDRVRVGILGNGAHGSPAHYTYGLRLPHLGHRKGLQEALRGVRVHNDAALWQRCEMLSDDLRLPVRVCEEAGVVPALHAVDLHTAPLRHPGPVPWAQVPDEVVDVDPPMWGSKPLRTGDHSSHHRQKCPADAANNHSCWHPPTAELCGYKSRTAIQLPPLSQMTYHLIQCKALNSFGVICGDQ